MGFSTTGQGQAKADEASVKAGLWPKLKSFGARIPFAQDALAAYYCALDRQTPVTVRITLWGALAYFVLPFDGIPDYLPLIGFADDAAAVATAIRLIASHMRPEHREAARRALEKLKTG